MTGFGEKHASGTEDLGGKQFVSPRCTFYGSRFVLQEMWGKIGGEAPLFYLKSQQILISIYNDSDVKLSSLLSSSFSHPPLTVSLAAPKLDVKTSNVLVPGALSPSTGLDDMTTKTAISAPKPDAPGSARSQFTAKHSH